MVRRWARVWLLSGILSALLPVTAFAAVNFNDTSFKTVWERVDKPVQNLGGTGRGYTWGPPAPDSEKVVSEPYNGTTRKVEYFDKARMEVNNPAGNPNDLFYVTTGLLVKELVTGNRQDGDNSFTFVGQSQVQVAGDSNENGVNTVAPTYASFKGVATFSGTENSHAKAEGSPIINRIDKAGQVSPFTPPEQRLLKGYDTVTQHNVADVFTDYGNLEGPIWNGQSYVQGSVFFGNALYVLGRPITEPYWVRAIVGGTERDVLLQLFERRVLTYTPSNPDSFKVEMGNVGQHYYRWRYEQSPTKLLGSFQFLSWGTTAGNFAFWRESDGDITTLYGNDLTRQTLFKIVQNSGTIGYPASDGKIIAWVQSPAQYGSGQQSIQGYDLATRTQFEIIKTAGSIQYSELSVDQGKIYYQKPNVSNGGIYEYNLATGQERLLVTNGYGPVVRDGIVVWATHRSLGTQPLDGFELSLHLLKIDGSQPETVIYKTGEDKSFPYLSGLTVSGNKVAWAFYPPDTRKFYLYDIPTAKTQTITTTLPVRNPIVSGDKVALTFSPEGGGQARTLGIYNLTTETTVTIARSSQPLQVWGTTAEKGVLYSEPFEDGMANLYFTSINR